MNCPLDYSLCDETVTLYRRTEDGVLRRVIPNARYIWEEHLTTDASGAHQERKFLLILPGQRDILPGDRVVGGIGPQITKAQWSTFLPVNTPGLSQVAYIKPCHYLGAVCHIEAGRR